MTVPAILTATEGGMMYRDVANAMTTAAGLATRVDQAGILLSGPQMAHRGGVADFPVGRQHTRPQVPTQAGLFANVLEKLIFLKR